MGIKHKQWAGTRKGRSSRKRVKNQTRLESEVRKTERWLKRLAERRIESDERRSRRKLRRTYGSRPAPCQCGSPAELLQHPRSGDFFWRCAGGCDCSVNCHPRSTIPMGTLADKNTREARNRVHRLFDLLWTGGAIDRKQAYQALAESMGLTIEQAHIGKFTLGQCEEAGAFARLALRQLYSGSKP